MGVRRSRAFTGVNIVLFFEGTGQGVPGKHTNVTRLHDACRADDRQHLHLEAGPGTRFGNWIGGRVAGLDWRRIFAGARRWFEQTCASLPPGSETPRVFLFGFSRGATLARHFASWLEKLDVPVAYLGVWDTVDATVGLDVSVDCPQNVQCARHAVARDERRRFFDIVPLRIPKTDVSRPVKVDEMVFPGVHSDVGGLYEDNHVIADVSLAWIAQGARRQGLRFVPGTHFLQRFDPAQVRLHDSRHLISNLWGALGTVTRALDGMRRHRSCRIGGP